MPRTEPAPLGTSPLRRPPHPARLYAGAAAIFLILLFVGIRFYVGEEATEKRKVADNLDAISQLKVGQIAQWRAERLGDAEFAAGDRVFVATVARWLHRPQARDAEAIVERLRAHRRRGGYFDVAVVDAGGRMRLGAGDQLHDYSPVDHDTIVAALRDGRPRITDLHPGPGDLSVHVDVVAPLVAADGRTLGAVVMQSRAGDVLYPMIAHWPSTSKTAESVIVERDGDDVRFLSPLRHRDNPPASLRLPLAGNDSMPAAMAVAGKEGLFAGTDYRGVPVVATLRPIPDSPWYLVAKIDADEAYADWNEHSVLMLWIAPFAVSAVLFLMAWLRARVAHFHSLYEAEAILRRAEQATLLDREHQATLRHLLETVLRGTPPRETLALCLDKILALPWLAIEPRGAIHLATPGGADLEMAVARNMAPEMLEYCAHLPLGRCLCGRAAASREILFADHVDARHEIAYDGMPDHGHYCVPLLAENRLMGVLVLYLQAGAPRDQVREEFIVAAAGVLAAYLGRQEIARELAEHRDHLEAVVRQRTAELATNEARTRAILRTMLEGVVQIDGGGFILSVNDATTSIFGYEEDELVGGNVSMLMPDAQRAAHDGYLARYLETRQPMMLGRSREVEGQRRDGSRFPMELTVNELVDDVGITFIGVMKDITERKATEAACQAARAEAEHMAMAKSEFLSNMSHEIRTPLAAVLGMAEVGLRDCNEAKARQVLTRIRDSGRHLLGVINGILDFSKIEAGRLEVERHPFRLAAVIDGAVALVADGARAKNLDLAVSVADTLPTFVAGDPLRLEQILVNLLSNAVKFTERGRVALTADREGGDTIAFSVADTGIGMDAEQLSRLFRPFEQADGSTTRRFGGTGLGLAISRNLAGLMGGEIAVTSKHGAGSVFVLRLPLPETAPVADESAPRAAGPRLAGLHLLAAEDVEVNRYVLEEFLTREGARVTFAANGREALDLLTAPDRPSYDAVLMDIQMPVMDGIEATRHIAALAPGLPVIGLTAHALAEERDHSLAAGMVGYVTKPIDLDVLVDALLRHTRRRTPPSPATTTTAPAESPSGAPLAAEAGGPIDWQALSARFGHRDAFIARLLETALRSHEDAPARLRDAAQGRDFATLALVAHTLKGLGGNIMAAGLDALARATEDSARAGRDDTTALAERLADDMDILLGEIRTALQAHATTTEEAR